MKGLVASCAAGKIEDDVVLDLSREEDFHGEADLPIAVLPKTGEIVLLQMDGDLSADEFDEAIDKAYEACYDIHDLQKQALIDRYEGGSNGGGGR
jgi:exosome complex component RRP41